MLISIDVIYSGHCGPELGLWDDETLKWQAISHLGFNLPSLVAIRLLYKAFVTCEFSVYKSDNL